MTDLICALPLISALLGLCPAQVAPDAVGYVEGEHVILALVDIARITALDVSRGSRVHRGEELVRLESRDAELAVEQARAELARAEAELANLTAGRRPEELAVIEAARQSAQAEFDEAGRAAKRIDGLADRGIASRTQGEEAATRLDLAAARLAQAEANLAVARLPARVDEVKAARQRIAAARAALAGAEWRLSRRTLEAPADGVISDVLRRPGDLAGPQQGVLDLLPDGATTIRLYVPEPLIATVSRGTRLAISCDGCAADLEAEVTYVADAPEFTPPVIYSLENRQKLVFLVEARDASGRLKPGQIVDARVIAP